MNMTGLSFGFGANTAENSRLLFLVNFAVSLLFVCLMYFLAFRPYKNYCLRKYGFKLNGVPAKLGVFCYVLYIAVGDMGLSQTDLRWFQGFFLVDMQDFWLFQTPDGVMGYISVLLVTGAPAAIIFFAVTAFKTKNLPVAALNIPVIYLYCVITAFFIVQVTALLLFTAVIGGMLAGRGKRRKTG